jgi:uncharacterized membrane protein (DUF373 family)
MGRMDPNAGPDNRPQAADSAAAADAPETTGSPEITADSWRDRLSAWVIRVVELVMSLVVDVLILVVVVAVARETVSLSLAIIDAVFGAFDKELLAETILEVLTIFIFLEIFHFFVDFLKNKTVNLANLVDVTLAIVFREVWVGLFSQKLHWQELLGIAAVIAAIGLVRWIAVGGRPGPRRESTEVRDADL